VIKDHRPFAVKRAIQKFEQFYVRHFLVPQLAALGHGFAILRPWYVEIFGGPVTIGKNVTLIANSDQKIRFVVWPGKLAGGRIVIGDNVIISPGARISAATEIIIGNNSMIANGAYITDSDWHGIYDRVSTGNSKPIHLEQNVWIGDSAIICKGTTIGENSIIGAGAVVVGNIPANCMAAGNPAKVLKRLNSDKKIVTRSQFFNDPQHSTEHTLKLERYLLAENTFLKWLRVLFFPRRGD
jgi:acetyltransferase-like isoleucine patch superfamily enzyme